MAECNVQFVQSEEAKEGFQIPINEELKAPNGQEERMSPNQGDSQVEMMDVTDSTADAITNGNTMDQEATTSSMDSSAEGSQQQASYVLQFSSTADLIKWFWASSKDRISVPAIVIHVMRTSANTIFPYEIGLTAFNMEQNIMELATCSLDLQRGDGRFTLLPNEGPVLKLHHQLPGIPIENRASRGNWIINKLEGFLRRHTYQNSDRPFLFCPTEMLPTVEWCLESYYGLMGKQFGHPIYPLEQLMVALSEGGLKYVAKHEIETLTFAEQIIKGTVSSMASRKTNGKVVTSKMISEAPGFKTIDPDTYFYFRNEPRLAAGNPDHVAAFLGAFFTEHDATSYLHDMLGPCLSTEPEVPCIHREKMHESEYGAMATSLWLTYLILDVVMINYSPCLKAMSWLSFSNGTAVPSGI